MEAEYAKFADCRECGWHGWLDCCEDIEVGYPSHNPNDLDQNWRHEKSCPVCGSTFLHVTWEEK